MQTMPNDSARPKTRIGRAEKVSFVKSGPKEVPARIDTGAKTSSLWATSIREENGVLRYVLFDKTSPFYDGVVHETSQFSKTVVASSIGQPQERYKIRILIKLKGRKIRARFTLADRSTQTYPILIGRNMLRGKFVVDVDLGEPLYEEERKRTEILRSGLKLGGKI
jgi:hypothetical protein